LPFATTFDRILFLRVYNVSGPCCKTLSIEDARGSLKAVLQVVSDSSIHCDELVSLPKSSLTHHLGLLGPKKTDEVNRALRIALELEKDALLYK
jgi:mRNA-degrading endonuclease toxin of MazEF toxin-antitoxin module